MNWEILSIIRPSVRLLVATLGGFRLHAVPEQYY
jgi:hypothetical protein